MLIVIHFVQNQQHWWLGFAEFLRECLVDRGKAFLGIDEKKDEVGRLHRDVRLDGDLLAKAVVKRRADAASVDQSAGMRCDRARRGNPISGYTGLVMHDRDLATC